MTRFRDRLLGDRDRLGWWTLPVFVAVGLAGAVLAGGLAVIYYSGQVNALRDETRSAREEASRARDEIRDATDEALETINEQVDAVRQSLTVEFPVEDASAVNAVLVRAFPGAAPQPSPSPAASPAAQGQANSGNQEDPPPAEEEPQQPEPPPDRGTPRFGVAFPVVRDGGTTFLATSFTVLEDPRRPGEFVSDIDVVTSDDTAFRAEVHSFDRGLDLALLRVVAEFDVPEWRPVDEAVSVGDKVWAVGLAPNLSTAQLGATVASVSPRVLLTDLVLPGFLHGGPLVDLDGRVVGIVSGGYRPFGADDREGLAAVPIRTLCEGLLRCSAEQQQGGTGESPAAEDG